jgi:D-alanyl-D-alanine endopeptidase (penicillin-binding protein 7)
MGSAPLAAAPARLSALPLPLKLRLAMLALGFAAAGVLAMSPLRAWAVQEETLDLPAAADTQAPVGMLPVRRPVSLSRGGEHVPAIKSAFAVVVDQDTNEILMQKNPDEVASIASITKLMTAMVTLDARLPLDETLQLSRDDRTIIGWRGSSLRAGVHLTRAQALHLALMSSENHAAQLLGRTYPGGVNAAVTAMNAKARVLGMNDSVFADPSGLSPLNRASPNDLVRLVKAAYDYPEIREFSVSADYELPMGKHLVRFHSTNKLTTHADWQIGLQKTGTLSAAGQCLVMQTVIEGRRVVMVLLDAIGRHSRFADAQRIHDWLTARGPIGKAALTE